MNIEERPIKKHLFICTNTRELKDSCGPKDSQSIIQSIKNRLREEGLWDEYRVASSGCLGPCARGISAIIFPENLMITEIGLSDTDELYKLLTNS